eukprot:g31616.t1
MSSAFGQTNSRRKTLGVLSQNTAPLGKPQAIKPTNKIAGSKVPQRRATMAASVYSTQPRQSLGPGQSRPSMGLPPPKPLSRQSMPGGRSTSMAGGRKSVGRRSSMYRANGKIADPREIGRKDVTKKHIMLLITYLTTHHYDRQISPKILSAPSTKDFRHMVTFLVQQIDPNFKFAPDKFEEEFKEILKIFCYPFGISKSSLAAVGTPHIWPTILGSVVWLVEFLLYEEELQKHQSGRDPLDMDNGDKMFFEYCAQAYKDFLEGVDEFELLNQDLAKRFEIKNRSIHEEINVLQQTNQCLSLEVERLKDGENELMELQTKKASLENDLHKTGKRVESQKEEQIELNRQYEQGLKEIKTLTQQLEEAKAENDELNDLLEKQEYSPFQVQSMTHRKQVLQEGLAAHEGEKERLMAAIWEAERALGQALSEADKGVREYNCAMERIKMLPSTASSANGLDFELRFNRNGTTHLDMASIDLKSFVKPALQSLKSNLSEHNLDLATETRKLKERVRHNADTVVEQKEKVASLQSRLNKIEETFKTERAEMKAKLQETVARVEEEELQIHKLKTTHTHSVSDSEKEVAVLNQQLIALKANIQKEQQAWVHEICAMVDKVTTHKVNITETLEALEAETRKVFEEESAAIDQ